MMRDLDSYLCNASREIALCYTPFGLWEFLKTVNISLYISIVKSFAELVAFTYTYVIINLK